MAVVSVALNAHQMRCRDVVLQVADVWRALSTMPSGLLNYAKIPNGAICM